MKKLRNQVVSLALTVMTLLSLIAVAPTSQVVAQGSETTSAGLVSGSYRVLVHQTVVDKAVADAGLTKSTLGYWAVLVTDVSNTGVDGPVDLRLFTLGTSDGGPLDMAGGVAADPASSAAASKKLGFAGMAEDGSLIVGENGTARAALVFPVDAAFTNAESLVLKVGDQVMAVNASKVDALKPMQLPSAAREMQLKQTTAHGTYQVTTGNIGGNDPEVYYKMSGVVTPAGKTDSDADNCFAQNTREAIRDVTGRQLWVEEVQGSDEVLIWYNDAANGNFGLLNSYLVSNGFGGTDTQSTSPYLSWLATLESASKQSKVGLWATCRTADGAYLPGFQPAPEPTKTAEERRAEYTVIDSRDLAIRPYEFLLEKIMVQGTVFNIQVSGGTTFMQIWLDGGSNAAVVVYKGDSTGIYEGTWVTVYGIGDGTVSGTNGFGARITQPAIKADLIVF